MNDSLYSFFNRKWRNKYPIGWCHHCNRAIIECPACHNTSCNGGGCNECHDDFSEFFPIFTCAEHYLDDNETKAYQKGLRLRRIIQDSLALEHPSINWRQMKRDGLLSQNDEEMFKEFLDE